MYVNQMAVNGAAGRVNSSNRTKRMVVLALLTAIVAALQVFATFVKFGPFSITLALTPIVVGAATIGAGASAYLGGVFGLVVLIACITGADMGGSILWNANPLLTAVLCLGKGALAGWCAGLVFRLFNHNDRFLGFAISEISPATLGEKIRTRRLLTATLAAAIVCPVVNTGIFCGAMALFFNDILTQWAGGSPLLSYVIVGLVGVNFLLELCINLILSPAVVRITKIRKK